MESLPFLPPNFLARTAVIAIVLSFWLNCAQGLDRNSPLRHFGRRIWQTDEGLPQNTVNDILQSKDGYLWIATGGGLARFDGIRFKVFDHRNTPQLHSNTINSLYQDTHGVLWIATPEGLTSYDGNRWSVLTTRDALPSNDVFSLYEDRQGALWILTANGIAEDKRGRISSFTTKNGLASGTIIAARDDAKGNLWIATEGGVDCLVHSQIESIYKGVVTGIAKDTEGAIWVATRRGLAFLANGKIHFLPRTHSFSDSDIETILADRHGRLWLGSSSGLAVWDKKTIANYTTHNGLPGNHIHKLYEDHEGVIWVSTEGGLARIVNGKVDALTTNSGLSAPLVLDMFEDREGSLWLGTDAGGLMMLRDQKFTSYTAADGLIGENTKAIVEDRDHSIWIGTDGGGLNRVSQKRFTAVRTKDGLSSDVVFALAEDTSGALWIGTPDGLNILQKGKMSRISSADGLPDDYIRSLFPDTDNSVWIGTRHGLARWSHGTITNYTEEDGLSSDFIGAMTKDKAGNLWIGTSHGLNVRSHGKFLHFTKREGLSNNLVTALYADAASTLWIGTKGGGLNKMRNGSLFSYDSLSALPENIYGIVADEFGNLWISSDRGIFRANIAKLNAYAEGHAKIVPISTYGTEDGMPTSECSSGGHPSVWRSQDDTLWFTTPRGAAAIQPQRAESNPTQVPVVIEQVSVDDRAVPLGSPLIVSPGHTRYAFQYAGLSFIAPKKVRYRYRLDGLDKLWIDGGTRRQAYYTNLRPGNYKFHVIAANNDGVWNTTGTSFSFQIKPHFYQTIGFYCALCIMLGLLIYEFYHLRMKRVSLQFHATLAERNRIAREIHDTLAQGFVGISLQLEVAKRVLGDTNQVLKECLDQALSLTNSSLSEARRSIWDLRSQAYGNQDFPARLAAVVDQARKRSTAKISLKVTGAYRAIPDNVAEEMLKIAQEATINAVRHANANHIHIQLAYEESRLLLTVSDDGHGFLVSRAKSSGLAGHFGMIGMKERAKLVGAALKIESNESSGTTVILSIPG
ncbi:MAG TPA: two-component regulator propeller domain-containing protein [Acidobacteriaceae bacterium]|nr:two-component regulator propeller domain-containing protein [Acidobacteriaceae bacterium]